MTRLEAPRPYEAAIKLLSLRPRSEQELFRRLEKRFGAREAGDAMLRLREEGYVDDLSFAGWWISQRMTFKPMGRIRLRHELIEHGVSGGVIAEALEMFTVSCETDAAMTVARKKLPFMTGERIPARLALFLSRRGFNSSVISCVLRSLREGDGDFY